MASTTKWEPWPGDGDGNLPAEAYAFPKQRKIPITDAVQVRSAIERFLTIREVSDKERRSAFEAIKQAAERFHVEIDGDTYEEMCGRPQVEVLPRD